jgi:flagellar biosynthetic protein FliP
VRKLSRAKRLLVILLVLVSAILLSSCIGEPGEDGNAQLTAPGVTLSVGDPDDPQQVSTGVQLLVLLTVLTLAPSIIVLATSFTRIVIVLSLLRNAIGTPTIPPNQVVIGLSLLLSFFIMAPVYNEINDQAIQPYLNNQISQEVAIDAIEQPVRRFMFEQTRPKDIELFLELSNEPQPETIDDIPTIALLPAFVISELRVAFTMGFVLYIPFVIIDMVISSILLAMGMMMLPPSMISLPFKLLLFIMADGWYLITRSLAMSFFS